MWSGNSHANCYTDWFSRSANPTIFTWTNNRTKVLSIGSVTSGSTGIILWITLAIAELAFRTLFHVYKKDNIVWGKRQKLSGAFVWFGWRILFAIYRKFHSSTKKSPTGISWGGRHGKPGFYQVGALNIHTKAWSDSSSLCSTSRCYTCRCIRLYHCL